MTILFTIARSLSASELLVLPFGRLFCRRLRILLFQRRKSEQISSAIVLRVSHYCFGCVS